MVDWYKTLRKKYGASQGQWMLWCKRPKTDGEREQVMMEAILTQRTNWRNVERAVAALKGERLLTLGAFLKAYQKNPATTSLLIQSSGFYQQKAQRLAGLAAFVVERYGAVAAMQKASLSHAREELLSLNGIGLETADSILLYALEKPIFVIDEYTRRFLYKKHFYIKGREGRFYSRSALKATYEELQYYFQNNLKKDYRLYQDFHALIVISEKEKALLSITKKTRN